LVNSSNDTLTLDNELEEKIDNIYDEIYNLICDSKDKFKLKFSGEFTSKICNISDKDRLIDFLYEGGKIDDFILYELRNDILDVIGGVSNFKIEFTNEC
jgi:hypothetical protein